MLFRNHLIVTAAVATYVSSQVQPETITAVCVIWGCIFLGSLLPDLDTPGSVMGSRLMFLSLPLSVVLGHRTITHSLWPVMLMYWLVDNTHGVVMLLAIGYASHLLADAVTDSGIPILWPLPLRLKPPFTVTTGGVLEYGIAYSLLGCALIAAFN